MALLGLLKGLGKSEGSQQSGSGRGMAFGQASYLKYGYALEKNMIIFE